LPVSIDVDQWSAPADSRVASLLPSEVLHPVESEPPQLPRPVDADRPGAGPVVGEERGVRSVVADQVVGEAVTVQVCHRIVEQPVAVEIQPDRVH
jgi:hypothetical protein